ncbi:hypothetical protein NESM_000241600 [Novymonas esmeraldas]|uniref:Uncharacterized protein n=1 Tax=Novymonas esmeraldas TaxID=1808958 RepID=A0AAW0F8B0_9TRYP
MTAKASAERRDKNVVLKVMKLGSPEASGDGSVLSGGAATTARVPAGWKTSPVPTHTRYVVPAVELPGVNWTKAMGIPPEVLAVEMGS